MTRDTDSAQPSFTDQDLRDYLESADAAALDALPFGVIRMDRDGIVRHYNRSESTNSGLSPARVVGRQFFSEVGPCMNNFMVSTRFETEPELDVTMDYVFTLRMRPTPVKIRLLKAPSSDLMHLAVTYAVASPA